MTNALTTSEMRTIVLRQPRPDHRERQSARTSTGVTGSPWGRRPDTGYPEPRRADRWIAEEPLVWLGPRRRNDQASTLGRLVGSGMVAAETATALALLVRQRAGVLVIAGRSGAGKSTLLEALLPWYPASDRRLRLRGSFEDFAWERDPRFDPQRAVLVAEEISGHLPVYLWGRPVARFLGWRSAGSALIATAHGEHLADIARLISGYPLRLPLQALAAFDIIVRLGPRDWSPHSGHAVTDVWATDRTGLGGLVATTLIDPTGLHRDAIRDVYGRLGGDIGTMEGTLERLRREIVAPA